MFSQTVGLLHLYQNPMSQFLQTGGRLTRDQQAQIDQDFQEFYIDVFDEVSKFGHVEEMHVCDNLADHLVGACLVPSTASGPFACCSLRLRKYAATRMTAHS